MSRHCPQMAVACCYWPAGLLHELENVFSVEIAEGSWGLKLVLWFGGTRLKVQQSIGIIDIIPTWSRISRQIYKNPGHVLNMQKGERTIKAGTGNCFQLLAISFFQLWLTSSLTRQAALVSRLSHIGSKQFVALCGSRGIAVEQRFDPCFYCWRLVTGLAGFPIGSSPFEQ